MQPRRSFGTPRFKLRTRIPVQRPTKIHYIDLDVDMGLVQTDGADRLTGGAAMGSEI